MHSVLDGVCRNDVSVVPCQVVFLGHQRQLHVGIQLCDVVKCPLALYVQNFHQIFPIACSHKLYTLKKIRTEFSQMITTPLIQYIRLGVVG